MTLVVLSWGTIGLGTSLSDAAGAYDKGDFKKAVEDYEHIIQEGNRNGSVYYNLGNSYFRAGEKGKAISAYLAARRLLPRDPDVKANLKFVHEQMVDKLGIQAPGSVMRSLSFWVDLLTPRDLFFFSVCFLSLALTLVFLSLLIRKWVGLRVWALLLGTVSILGFGAFATSLYYQETWGAVSAALADVRSGPGEQNTVVFQLHEGAPFILDAKESSWLRIRLSDEKTGWIASKDVRVFMF